LRQKPVPRERAGFLYRFGSAHLELGQLDKALRRLTRALAQQRKCKEIPLQIRTLTELSRAYLLKKQYKMAIRCSQTAVGLLGEVEDDIIAPRIFLRHSQSLMAIGKSDAADEALCKSFNELQVMGSRLSRRMRLRFLEAVHYNREIIDAVGNRNTLSS
jgi:tetratricopeptide (TPR) repeat protein